MGQAQTDDGLDETIPVKPADKTAAPVIVPTADKPAEAAPIEAAKPEPAPVIEPKNVTTPK
jgi:hypothetical protein